MLWTCVYIYIYIYIHIYIHTYIHIYYIWSYMIDCCELSVLCRDLSRRSTFGRFGTSASSCSALREVQLGSQPPWKAGSDHMCKVGIRCLTCVSMCFFIIGSASYSIFIYFHHVRSLDHCITVVHHKSVHCRGQCGRNWVIQRHHQGHHHGWNDGPMACSRYFAVGLIYGGLPATVYGFFLGRGPCRPPRFADWTPRIQW